MKVHVLGSAGWIPGQNETSCFLIEDQGNLIMLDAGTGVSNLYGCQEILDRYDTLTVILSHYHIDHMVGLIYLLPFIKGKTLRLIGPGQMGYPESNEGYLRAFLKKEFFSRDLSRFSEHVLVEDFPGETFNIGKTKISVRPQIHSSPSYEITINDDLIYATDSVFNPEEWKERSAKLVMHECWDIDYESGKQHTSLEMLMNGLDQKSFEKILLIHKNPDWTDEDYKKIRKKTDGTAFEIAEDGIELTI